jgi:MFS family permease
LFFIGQTISLIGTWITRVATSWLVYRLTGSAALLGVVSFAGQIPTFLLGPFAGVWVDRVDRYKAMIVTQVLSMLQSAALAVLALSGVIRVWHILVLSVAQGLINSVDIPARQSYVVEMVEGQEDLPNAIALNSSMVNGARLIGPSVAGVLVALFGEGWCFLIDAISYIAVIASLLMMVVKPFARRPQQRAVLQDLRAGFSYVSRFLPVRAALLLLALMSLMGMPYTVLMPIIAARVLHGGPHTLGILMSASGLGALGGALFLAARKSVLGLGRVIAFSAALFGVSLCAFSFARNVPLAVCLLVLVGVGFMVQTAATNTILQTIVSNDMRGRVMSFYSMAFMGMAPFGSLIAGLAAGRIGAPWTIFAGGVACVAGASMFARVLPQVRAEVRPVYRQLGILPEIASGLAQATTLSEEER